MNTYSKEHVAYLRAIRTHRQAVRLCAEADYKMKSGGGDARELLKETVLRIAAGESDA